MSNFVIKSNFENAIKNNEDIHSSIDIKETISSRITIADVDKGSDLKHQISNLQLLVKAYEMGIIKENTSYKYVKILTNK